MPSGLVMRSKFYMTASPRACRSFSFSDFIAPYWFSRSRSFLLLRMRVSHHFHVSTDLISLPYTFFAINLCTFFCCFLLPLLTSLFYHLSCSLSATSSSPFFRSLCQCSSSCQFRSFCKSVCHFLCCSKITPCVWNIVRRCVSVHGHAWAIISGFSRPYTVHLVHSSLSNEGVIYFHLWNIFLCKVLCIEAA